MMKNKMKLTFSIAAIVCIVSVTAFMASADSFQQSAETEQIQEAFIGAQETLLEMGKFHSDSEPVTGTTADLTEEERASCIQAYTDKVNLYYAENNAVRQSYIDQYTALIDDAYQTKVNYIVDCGILDCTLNEVSFSDGGNTATAQVTYTVWNKWIGETDSDQFEVAAPVNKSRETVIMVKEDGNWKLLETSDWSMEFADDAVTQLEASAETSSISNNSSDLNKTIQTIHEAQAICSTEYSTFREALDAANQIDANAINPFVLES